MVDFGRHALELENWPCVDIGEEEVSPLRNESIAIAGVLKKYGMENCSVLWSLGQHKLTRPLRIATSAQGHFLIVDQWGPTVKVFDNKGNFCFSFFPEEHNLFAESEIIDISTAHADMDGKIYLLVEVAKTDTLTKTFDNKVRWEVRIFNKTANLLHTVSVRNHTVSVRNLRNLAGKLVIAKLTVTSSKLLLLIVDIPGRNAAVDVYELSGEPLGTFGEGVWTRPTDITATCDGHVMMVDHPNQYDSCVYVFTVEGRQLTKAEKITIIPLHDTRQANMSSLQVVQKGHHTS